VNDNPEAISAMTVHEKFVEDMRAAGIVTAPYRGRFFWEGPAAHSDQQNGPTLQDIVKKTAVPLQWDARNSNYIVYPVGKATARWNDKVADSEGEELEPDGYKDAYAAQVPKDGDEGRRMKQLDPGQTAIRLPVLKLGCVHRNRCNPSNRSRTSLNFDCNSCSIPGASLFAFEKNRSSVG